MYCINCGIELSQGQAHCPICKTKVYHPNFPVDPNLSTYPVKSFQSEEYNRKGLMFVITILSALTALLPILLEVTLFKMASWSAYVSTSLVLGYILLFLPLWFRNPNPVIFIPCDFAAVALYLLFINFMVSGKWFLSFALPVTVMLGIIITAVAALLHYLRRGRLYIIGGGLIGLGMFAVYLEFFIWFTFEPVRFIFWSLFPLVALGTLGMMIIIIAIVKPFKESLRKYFYM